MWTAASPASSPGPSWSAGTDDKDGEETRPHLSLSLPLYPRCKADFVAERAAGMNKQNVYGYGNTRNDIDFLEKTGKPFTVMPDTKLRAHAALRNWSTKFHHVNEANAFWAVNRAYGMLLSLGTRRCKADCQDHTHTQKIAKQ
jgi:hypothetical protein